MTKKITVMGFGPSPLATPMHVGTPACRCPELYSEDVLHGVVICSYVTVSQVFHEKRLFGKICRVRPDRLHPKSANVYPVHPATSSSDAELDRDPGHRPRVHAK